MPKGSEQWEKAPGKQPHLQMVDVLLRVKIDALGRLLYRHHREPHVNAAMQLLSLYLQTMKRVS